MIKLQNMTPNVYYNQSRDFQFIGRLFDVLLNSIKTNTELITNLPLNDDLENRLLDLLTMTLGFKSLHEYNIVQLRALCSAFMSLLHKKGTYTAIEKACSVLINAEGITNEFSIDIADNNVTIYLPPNVNDTNLLKDILIYILPAGMTCEIVKTLRVNIDNTTKILVDDSLKYAVELSDRNAMVIPGVKHMEDHQNLNKNKIFNVIGATPNTTTVNTSNICKFIIEQPENGMLEFGTANRNLYAVWEPIKLKVTPSDGYVLDNLWFKLEAGNIEPVNFEKYNDYYIINIYKTLKNYTLDWANMQTITILATFKVATEE